MGVKPSEYSPPSDMVRFPSLPALLRLCLVVLAMLNVTASAATWDIAKIDGRDYVSLESVKNFYRFTKLSRHGKDVLLENPKVEMRLHVGSQECTMNNVKFVLSYNIEASGEKALISRIDLVKLIDPVLRPNYIANAGGFRTVILDAGHGGKDAGATSGLGTEAGYTLKVCQMAKALLEAQGFKVVMTRDSDRFISLEDRVRIANATQEDAIFIAIHFNSGGSAARGIETFTLSPQGIAHYGSSVKSSDFMERSGNEHDSANMALATALHGAVLRRLGTNTFDRGIKRARWSVLSGVKHPAILFEGGFVSHPFESRLIHNEAYQRALANGVVDAVKKYRFAVSQRPEGER